MIKFPYRESTFNEIIDANRPKTVGKVAKELEAMFKVGLLVVSKNRDGRHVYVAVRNNNGISSSISDGSVVR